VSIRLGSSGTPLERRHELVAAGRATRRRVTIPFTSFDRARYPTPALALAVSAQRALALGEYGAVHLFARLASGVSLNAAPLDLVLAAASVPADEARHSELALRMAEQFSGEPAEVRLDRAGVPKSAWTPMEIEEVDMAMIEICAIGETLAAALLAACRDIARDPVPRALFTSLTGDEVHHARLGWYYLAWRAPQWSRTERQRAADRAGAMIAQVERGFWKGRDAPPGSRRAARALGVLDSPTQRRVIRSIMEDEIVPGLDALGLGASHAWRVRVRGS